VRKEENEIGVLGKTDGAEMVAPYAKAKRVLCVWRMGIIDWPAAGWCIWHDLFREKGCSDPDLFKTD
jgi:hypothetical protein